MSTEDLRGIYRRKAQNCKQSSISEGIGLRPLFDHVREREMSRGARAWGPAPWVESQQPCILAVGPGAQCLTSLSALFLNQSSVHAHHLGCCGDSDKLCQALQIEPGVHSGLVLTERENAL